MLLDLDSKRLVHVLLVVGVLALSGACSSGGGGNSPPTLTMNVPDVDVNVEIGTVVALNYTDRDTDDVAMTTIYADADGDVATVNDRYVVAQDRPDADGVAQAIQWNTAGIPEGSYFIVGVTDDGTNTPVVAACPGKVLVWTAWPRDHSNIVLRDHQGDAILLGSDAPYSPRQTCGVCHDIDEISNGYHFQQGRTDATGAIQTADDFFGDGRSWLKSDGMYGKW
jgi:hypothetical protein